MSSKNGKGSLVKKYSPLATAAGIGSMLGSGCIIGLSATLPVWKAGLNLSVAEIGIISGSLTFAIAFGSLLAGQITKWFGLIRAFNWLNLIYAVGAGLCIAATNFIALFVGVIVIGLASGCDLPISLTVVSHDAPDEATSAELISSTQIFWMIGVFISYICSFLLSGVKGVLGARLVFGILLVFAIITWLWRTLSKQFRQFHEDDAARQAAKTTTASAQKISLRELFDGTNGRKYLKYFVAILTFYVFWNLIANTWGQFQTYALTNAGASQTQATGLGIILNLVALLTTIAFASVAGGKWRNVAFFVGAFIQLGALVGMAFIGGSAGFMPLAITIGLYNVGSPLAGESIYKVWTQESFPMQARASLQGIINGSSRMVCGLFALVTPFLVMPSHIKMSMFGFSGIVVVVIIAGTTMMHLQHKYHQVTAKSEANEGSTVSANQ
ncbi:MFS transporter [Lactobacillus curvatus] [Lactiplantibacillus mudanjiangensis]|uniref:MFS transporter n=1 Tax=Lactiplantibacillus mudanjiangensis TaxID=1296538 RepID=UPI0010152F7D|nr:MFS transporter [Lactiplantibacillus mudanjiangensis]VDG32070.1 MFS transporter [Lactobacillus curvatus] [Lactiplantibacillus mudanjiangensis]